MTINKRLDENKTSVKVVGLVFVVPILIPLTSLSFPLGLILNFICIAASFYGAYLGVRYGGRRLAVVAISATTFNLISFFALSAPSFLIGVLHLLFVLLIS